MYSGTHVSGYLLFNVRTTFNQHSTFASMASRLHYSIWDILHKLSEMVRRRLQPNIFDTLSSIELSFMSILPVKDKTDRFNIDEFIFSSGLYSPGKVVGGCVSFTSARVSVYTSHMSISFLSLFVNVILAPAPPSPAHLFLHPSLLPLLIHHFVHL